jgi:hypothetical protein
MLLKLLGLILILIHNLRQLYCLIFISFFTFLYKLGFELTVQNRSSTPYWA